MPVASRMRATSQARWSQHREVVMQQRVTVKTVRSQVNSADACPKQ
jgi:hypothetical protein